MNAVRPSYLAAAAAALTALVGSPAAPPGFADPLPFGPDTCISGFVWREARSGDTVCVTPDVRARTLQENADPSAHRDPDGAYGPESCAQGFVWREAFDGDTICVTPDERAATKADNAAAASRRASSRQPQQAGTVVFEVTGPGEVFGIVTDPDSGLVPDHTALPFSRTITIGPDVHLLQVVATGRDTPGPGCRIILNGTVVSQEPIGGSAHCIYPMP